MAVEYFTFVPDRFPTVRFTGGNLAEVEEFAGSDRVVVEGDVVTIQLGGGESQVLRPGWAVSKLGGSLVVSAPRAQELTWLPVK